MRVGRLLEVIDALALDSADNYLEGHPEKDDIFFVTMIMDGIEFKSPLRSNADFGISVYPISATNSTLTVRADLVQKRGMNQFENVFSANWFMAARNR